MFEHSGGVAEIVTHIAHGLKAKGYDIRIITPRPAGFRGQIPKDYILLGTSRRLNGVLSTAGDIAIQVDGDEIDRVLEREKFDVINYHEPWLPVLTRQIVARSKSANVATFHANLADSMTAKSLVKILTPYGRSIGEKMHLFTATSPASADALVGKGRGQISGDLIDNIKYIPCAVDLDFYRPFKKRTALSGEGTKTIVYIGRPDKRKGVDWLIKAFALLVKEMPDAYLIVAGSGSRLSTLKQMVKSQNIPNVTFPGRVSDLEKRRLIGNADLTCYASTQGEGFGIVLIESMAMGTFPLAGNNLGYRGVMKGEGRIGLVDPEAIQDFANRMAAFLVNPDLTRMMNAWAVREARQYNYPKIVDQYESAYKEAYNIWSKANKLELEEEKNAKSRKARNWFSLRRHAR